MKKSLQNKLKTYSSVAAGVLVASSAGAQIVYTDINPDTTMIGIPNSFDIDFNGDMTPEFQLKMYYSSATTMTFARVYPQSSLNEVMATSYVDVLNLNNTISAGQSFYNAGSVVEIDDWELDMLELYTGTTTTTWGKWGGTNTDKYIGVKFNLSGNTHYGWIRVDADLSQTSSNNWSITIKDFAYQSTPDSSILAGDKGYTTNLEGIRLIKI